MQAHDDGDSCASFESDIEQLTEAQAQIKSMLSFMQRQELHSTSKDVLMLILTLFATVKFWAKEECLEPSQDIPPLSGSAYGQTKAVDNDKIITISPQLDI